MWELGHNATKSIVFDRKMIPKSLLPSLRDLTWLQIYNDVLHALRGDPLGGVCSPSLLGSNGVCPLTIIATIPDICRHMSNLIARAEHEIYLATNYWMTSEGSKLISHAFRELSDRAGRRGTKVVAKVIYDRGNAKQVTSLQTTPC